MQPTSRDRVFPRAGSPEPFAGIGVRHSLWRSEGQRNARASSGAILGSPGTFIVPQDRAHASCDQPWSPSESSDLVGLKARRQPWAQGLRTPTTAPVCSRPELAAGSPSTRVNRERTMHRAEVAHLGAQAIPLVQIDLGKKASSPRIRGDRLLLLPAGRVHASPPQRWSHPTGVPTTWTACSKVLKPSFSPPLPPWAPSTPI